MKKRKKLNEDEILNVFFRKKPAKLLIRLENKTIASHLAKKVDLTYSHTVKVLLELEKYALIKRTKSGRTQEIELTETGRKVRESLAQIYEFLGGTL